MRSEVEVRAKLNVLKTLLAEPNDAQAVLPINIPFICHEEALEWVLGADNGVADIQIEGGG